LDNVIHTVEKTLKEHDAKIGASEKGVVMAAVEKAKSASKADDVQTIKQASSDLKAAASGLSKYASGDGQAAGHTRARPGQGWSRRRDRRRVRGEKVRPSLRHNG
jgi:molecular chaperone DnaK